MFREYSQQYLHINKWLEDKTPFKFYMCLLCEKRIDTTDIIDSLEKLFKWPCNECKKTIYKDCDSSISKTEYKCNDCGNTEIIRSSELPYKN